MTIRIFYREFQFYPNFSTCWLSYPRPSFTFHCLICVIILEHTKFCEISPGQHIFWICSKLNKSWKFLRKKFTWMTSWGEVSSLKALWTIVRGSFRQTTELFDYFIDLPMMGEGRGQLKKSQWPPWNSQNRLVIELLLSFSFKHNDFTNMTHICNSRRKERPRELHLWDKDTGQNLNPTLFHSESEFQLIDRNTTSAR